MQIVIDLDEKEFRDFVDNGKPISMNRLCGALYHGIPLPKRHGDLIDRDVCLAMKSCDLVDADGVTMYAVPTGNILRINAVIPADKEEGE